MEKETTVLKESEFVLRRLLEPMAWPALLWPVLFAFAVLLFIVLMRKEKRLLFLGAGSLVLLVVSGVYLTLGYFMMSTLSWWLVLVPTLFVGLIYVILMYVRDCHSISVPWAAFLALLRLSVYGLLAVCFLLPAIQNYEVTVTESKILVLFDISGSIDETDGASSKSRLEHIVDFLERPYVKGQGTNAKTFIEHLQDVAPVTCYRFGGIDDYEPVDFKIRKDVAQKWSAVEWRNWLEMKADRNQEPTPLADALFPFTKLRGKEPVKDEDINEAKKRKSLFDEHVKAIKGSTDIGGSIRKVLERESGSRIQAVLVFSDGRSNVPDQAALEEVSRRASDKAKAFHVITVGVGNYQPVKKLEVDPLIAPSDRRIDDKKLEVHVPFTGSGLANKEFEVYVYAKRVKDDNDKELTNPQSYLMGYERAVFGGGPSPGHQSDLEIVLANMHPAAAKALEKKLLLERGKPGVKLKAKDKDYDDDATPTLEEAKKKDVLGEWEFVAEVRVLNDDVIRARRGYSTTVEKVQINEAPIRILLFSSGPSRDYQFVKGVFARELQQNRAKLSIYLQTAKDEQTEVTEDAEGMIWLPDFPTRLDVLKKGAKGAKEGAPAGKKGDPMNLKSYDVIIAFDADWEQLVPMVKAGANKSPLELLKEWVGGEHRGGLIFVSGPQYTARLIPPPDPDKRKAWPLKPVFDLMPVILKRPAPNLKNETLHDSTIPYQLNFTADAKAFDFLQLNPKNNAPLGGWEEFFGKPVKEDFEGGLIKVHPERGFHTYYRVEDIKDQAIVLATFLDPKAPKTTKGKDQPYFVVLPFAASGKTFYIGSGEMWRLRTFKEKYHQLFWQNLVRYVSARTSGKSHGQWSMKGEWEPGPIDITVEVRDKNFMPLDPKLLDPKHPLKVQVKRLGAGVGDKEEPQKIDLKPRHKTTKPDGQFVAVANLPGEGRFELRIDIPDANAYLKKDIVVRKKGVERGDLRTDFAKLQMVASEPTPDMRKRLQERAAPKQAKGEEENPPPGSSAARLFFPLPLAEMTTECLVRTEAVREIRKADREDVWNLGPLVYKIESWAKAPWLYVTMFALPAGILLIATGVMLIGSRWLAAVGLVVALLAVEAGMLLVTWKFTPAQLFNPSVLGVLLVVPTLIGVVAAGILLMAERYAWVLGVLGVLLVYLLGLSLYYWVADLAPGWFLDPLPVDFVWLLLLIGLLLSLEWFTRKMLRLA